MERIASLDVGDRRIGVAISDATQTLAQPLDIILHKNWRQDIQSLACLLSPYQTQRLVLGNPLQEDGSASMQSQKVFQFGDALVKAGYIVEYFDERESSQEASELLRNAGKRAQRGKVDSAAAAVILQRYLDSLSSLKQ